MTHRQCPAIGGKRDSGTARDDMFHHLFCVKTGSVGKVGSHIMHGWIQALCLSLALAGAVPAQDTLPRSVPNLELVSGGQVQQMVRQADGGVIVAGTFSSFNGVPR
jgi:hypothetical protein